MCGVANAFQSGINNYDCVIRSVDNTYCLSVNDIENDSIIAQVEICDNKISCNGDKSFFETLPLLDLTLLSYNHTQSTILNERTFEIKNDKLIDINELEILDNNINHLRIDILQEGEQVDWMSYDGFALASLPRSIIHSYNLLHSGIGAIVLDRSGNIFMHCRAANKRLFPSMLDMLMGGVSAAGESSTKTLLRELQEELGLDFVTPESKATKEKESKKKKSDALLKSMNNEDDVTAYLEFKKSVLDAILGPRNDNDDTSSDGIGSNIRKLGQTKIFTSYNHCLVDMYAVICSKEKANNISFNDGEVEWGRWVSPTELLALLNDDREQFVPDGLQCWDAIPDLLKSQSVLIEDIDISKK